MCQPAIILLWKRVKNTQPLSRALLALKFGGITSDIVPMASDFASPSRLWDPVQSAFWKTIKNRDMWRQISASVGQEPTGSFHLLQLSREATCWVKPRVTSEHGASWEIQFRGNARRPDEQQHAILLHLLAAMPWNEYSPLFPPSAAPRVAPSVIMISVKVAEMWNISSVAIQSYLSVW